MPRLRHVGLTKYELDRLTRELTFEQRDALVDAGWTHVAAAFEFAVRQLPELWELWESRLAAVPPGVGDAWLEFVVVEFWGRAVPLLVANPRQPDTAERDVPAEPRDETAGAGTAAPRRPKQPKRAAYGHPDQKYPSKQVAEAVRRWREGGEDRNVSEISRRTALSRPLVDRIGRLDAHGAFQLGPRGGLRLLGTDGKFRAAGASVSIRALEMALRLPSLA